MLFNKVLSKTTKCKTKNPFNNFVNRLYDIDNHDCNWSSQTTYSTPSISSTVENQAIPQDKWRTVDTNSQPISYNVFNPFPQVEESEKTPQLI